MESLTSRLGTRFLIVTVVPNVLLLGYLGFLFAAGAPGRHPSLERAIKSLDGLSIRQIVVIVLVLLVVSVATHPLQAPLIRLLEGYWESLPFGPAVQNKLTVRFRNETAGPAGVAPDDRSWGSADEQAAAAALRRRYWLPPKEKLLPTVLGNTLQAGEHRAGSRYGLNLDYAWPRLRPLLPDPVLADLTDRRNQLDAAARLCIAAGLATAAGIGLLIWNESWLFLPLVTYLLCWGCYRAAVAAAQDFSTSLAAAVDLHHLDLLAALQLDRPADLSDEYDLNDTLNYMFRSGLPRPQRGDLRYRALPPDKPAGSTDG
jgi:hypothetical protein